MPSTITDRLNGLTTSVAVKAPCRAATTAAISLSGLQTIDGVVLAARDRVLVKDQADPVENGIWAAQSAAWVRATDFNGSLDAVGGTQVSVIEGTANSGSYWRVTGVGSVTIAVDDIEFELALLDDSATMSFIQAGAGAVTRSARDKMRDAVSFLDYGAVGNGTTGGGGTDDTAAIQAAIDANPTRCEIDGSGLQYRTSAAIQIPVGRNLTIRNATFIASGDHVVFEKKAGAGVVNFFTMENVLINAEEHTTVGRYAFDFRGFSFSTWREVWVNGTPDKTVCFYGAGDASSSPYYNKFDHLYCGNMFIGIQLEDTDIPHGGCNSIQIMSSRLQPGANNFGIYVGKSNQNISIFGCICESGGGTGIYNGGEATAIFATRFEGMQVGVNYTADADYGTEFGCYYSGNTANRMFAGASESQNSIFGEYVPAGAPSSSIAGITTLRGGAKLPNSEVADANALDWYQESAFTPVLVGITTPGTGTYSTQAGRYTRIGRIVHFSLVLDWSAHDGTGGMRIDGLPFTIKNEADRYASFVVVPESLTYSNALAAQGAPNTASVTLYSIATGAARALVNMDTAGKIYVSGSYAV